MKFGKIFWMVVIVASVLVPTIGWAEERRTTETKTTTTTKPASEPSFFIEGYTGGGAASNTSKVLDGILVGAFSTLEGSVKGSIDPFVFGGLKLGYWFTPNGTYALAYPDWMKYLGFFTDFSYQRLNFKNQNGTLSSTEHDPAGINFEASGSLITWAFMFAGRYGFLQGSEVPFGRLQPYLAVGPAIFFSDQKAAVTHQAYIFGPNTVPAFVLSGAKDSVKIGLVVETGLRYFFNKSISVEASFKYRYFQPSYKYACNMTAYGPTGLDRGSSEHPGGIILNFIPTNFDTNSVPHFNLYSGQIGVAYHF